MRSNIVFDDQAVLLPPLPDIFDRPLWVATQAKVGSCPEWKVKAGDWVDRGQVLCTFMIKRNNFFSPANDLSIKSPVEGEIVFHGDLVSFSHGITDADSYQSLLEKNIHQRDGIVIAVPKGSYIPDTANEAVNQFCSDLLSLKEKIFFAPREFKGRFNESEIDKAINTTFNAPLLKVPLSEYRH